MAWYLYVAVIAAGFGAGFINTLAGSGSLITLPLLIFLGLPANVANATNRVGVLAQSLSSTLSFRQQGVLDLRGGLSLALPAITGAVIGAQIAVDLDEQLMRRTIGVLMIVMLVVLFFRPNRWLRGHEESDRHKSGGPQKPGWLQYLIFFATGIYAGFIQAGVGIFLLSGLVLSLGYDLVRANAVKSLLNVCFTLSAMLVFLYHNQIWWSIGLLLALGNAVGGMVAARVAVEQGAAFVRWVLMAVIIVSAAGLLGVFEWIAGLF